MSLCVSHGTIAPELWPHDLTRLDLGLYDPDIRPGWRHVPETADGLCDWASMVQPDVLSSRTGERRMIYQPSIIDPFWPPDASYEVAIIVHGFVSAIDFRPFGNWTRREHHTPAAVRTICLEACGHHDAFDCQRNTLLAVEEFVEFVEGATRRPFYEDEDPCGVIRGEQNVFARNRPTDRNCTAMRLTDNMDRGRHARELSRDWRVVPPPPTFIRRPSGTDFPISAEAIREGDFVELTITPTIRRIRRDGVVQPTLLFDIVKTVKLRSSAEPSTRLSPYPIHPIPPPSKYPLSRDNLASHDDSYDGDDTAFGVVDDRFDMDEGSFCLTPLPDDDMVTDK